MADIRGTMHLLLIEDNLDYLEALASVLRQKLPAIASIRRAASVEEAIAEIHGDHPLDLVLTDTQIRGGNCIDVLLKVQRTDYLVIFMSTMDNRDPRIRWMNEAGFPFYSKQQESGVLIDLIIMGGSQDRTADGIEKLRDLANPVAHRPEPAKKKPWYRLW